MDASSEITATLYAASARYHSRWRHGYAGSLLVPRDELVRRRRRRAGRQPDRHPPQQFEVADVCQWIADVGHFPVEDRRHVVPDECDVSRLHVTVHEGDRGRLLRLPRAEFGVQPLEARQRPARDPGHIAVPSVELPVEEIGSVPEPMESGLPTRSTVWMSATCSIIRWHIACTRSGCCCELGRDLPLEHVTRDVIHDEERATEHVTRRFHPERRRRRHRGGSEGGQDVELALQVVRLEQAGLRRTYP